MAEKTADKVPESMAGATRVTKIRRPDGAVRSVLGAISTVTVPSARIPDAVTAAAICSRPTPSQGSTSMHKTRWPRMVICPTSVIDPHTGTSEVKSSPARPGRSRPETVSKKRSGLMMARLGQDSRPPDRGLTHPSPGT